MMTARLISFMRISGEVAVKKAYAAYISMLHDDRDTAQRYIRSLGYVEVEVDESRIIHAEDTTYLHDGRVLMQAHGKKWACDAELYRRRRDEFFSQMKARQLEESQVTETKSVVGTEVMSTMICPKCGDSLQHAAVCPKCAAGKLGYRHRYTCVCGGVDLISKEAL